MRIDLGHGRLLAGGRFDLGPEFDDCTRPAPRHGLITGGEDTPDAKRPMQWIKRHERDRGRAIWIRDQSGMLLDVVAIYFRDHQRNIRFHPKDRRIIDDNGASRACDRCVLPRDIPARAEKGEIDALKDAGKRSFTAISSLRNEIVLPAERLEDKGSRRSTGNPGFRGRRVAPRHCSVAPTTAM